MSSSSSSISSLTSFSSSSSSSGEKKATRPEPLCMIQHKRETEPFKTTKTTLIEDKDLKEVSKVLINTSYISSGIPKLIKTRIDPPIANQSCCVFYFVPSSKAIPDKDGCYGVVKIRGCFSSEEHATDYSVQLVKTIDAYHENIIGYTGQDFPLTSNSRAFDNKDMEVDIRKKIDDVSNEDLKKQRREERQEMEDMTKRQEKLLQDVKDEKTISTDDLDYYITLHVKKASLKSVQQECEQKQKECCALVRKVNCELTSLDDTHPEFRKQCLDKYKESLRATGVPEEKLAEQPIVKYFMDLAH
jgi:hypothetical protein